MIKTFEEYGWNKDLIKAGEYYLVKNGLRYDKIKIRFNAVTYDKWVVGILFDGTEFNFPIDKLKRKLTPDEIEEYEAEKEGSKFNL